MAEFLAGMDGGEVAKVSFHFRKVVNADDKSARLLLSRALETLGYEVVSDDPLVAKRGGRGWSGAGLSYDVRDYPTRLAILLRPMGERATVATFDYSIINAMMSGGDKRTLEREAEAAIALAVSTAAATVCGTCGTEVESNVRFCRACGAAAVAAPAELEVLRQAAETHAAYRGVLVGTVGVVLSFLTFALIIALKGAAHLTPAIVFSLMWAVPALLSLAFGLRRMNRALTQGQGTGGEAKTLSGAAGGSPSLPEHRSPPSITEGTTKLLVTMPPERTVVPVKRRGSDTDPLS